MVDYATFKSTCNDLERLQDFKIPLTKLWENFIMCYSLLDITDDSLCEYCLIGDNEQQYKDIDKELETTTAKLARLLYLKEEQLKETVKQYYNESK